MAVAAMSVLANDRPARNVANWRGQDLARVPTESAHPTLDQADVAPEDGIPTVVHVDRLLYPKKPGEQPLLGEEKLLFCADHDRYLESSDRLSPGECHRRALNRGLRRNSDRGRRGTRRRLRRGDLADNDIEPFSFSNAGRQLDRQKPSIASRSLRNWDNGDAADRTADRMGVDLRQLMSLEPHVRETHDVRGVDGGEVE